MNRYYTHCLEAKTFSTLPCDFLLTHGFYHSDFSLQATSVNSFQVVCQGIARGNHTK